MVMAKDAHLEHLASVPLFSACSRKELERIAPVSDEISVPAGRVLTAQGDLGQECFVVVEGTVTVDRNGTKLATLGPGSCVGELALLDNGPRTATVTAASPLTVLVIQRNAFRELLDQVPSIAIKLLVSVAGRLREVDERAFG